MTARECALEARYDACLTDGARGRVGPCFDAEGCAPVSDAECTLIKDVCRSSRRSCYDDAGVRNGLVGLAIDGEYAQGAVFPYALLRALPDGDPRREPWLRIVRWFYGSQERVMGPLLERLQGHADGRAADPVYNLVLTLAYQLFVLDLPGADCAAFDLDAQRLALSLLTAVRTAALSMTELIAAMIDAAYGVYLAERPTSVTSSTEQKAALQQFLFERSRVVVARFRRATDAAASGRVEACTRPGAPCTRRVDGSGRVVRVASLRPDVVARRLVGAARSGLRCRVDWIDATEDGATGRGACRRRTDAPGTPLPVIAVASATPPGRP